MKQFKYILAILLVFPLALSMQQAETGIQFEQIALEEALELAKESNKPVFMDVYATWCGPCKKMDKVVFNDPQVAAYYNEHFVNLKKDVEKTDGPKVQEKYGVRYLPTLLFLKPDGTVIKQAVGFQNSEQFLELAQDVVNRSASN